MPTLTQLCGLLVAVLLFLPLSSLLIRLASGSSTGMKCSLVLVFASSLWFFSVRHHQDLYRGLDTTMYANIAKAFRAGVPAIRIDEAFAAIPVEASDAFLYKKHPAGPTHRKSHDKAFFIYGDGVSRPWFLIMYPLVASTMPDGFFVPLLGALWLSLLFAACCRGHAAAGIGVFLAIVFATPYPLWFFRGEYAEVAGSVLLASTLLSHSLRPLKRPAEFAVVAFLLGLATAFHRSVFLLALPIVLLLFAEAGMPRNRMAVVLGFSVGLMILVLETRFVSGPRGDWTQVISTDSEEFSRGLMWLGFHTQYLLPKSFVYFATGLMPFLNSLGFLAPLLFLAGCLAIFRDKRSNLARKALPFLLVWGLVVCITRLGRDGYSEKIVGVWNFRRPFPGVILILSMIAVPLSGLAAGCLSKFRQRARLSSRRVNAAAVLAAAILCAICVARNPVAYFAVDGRGSREIAAEIGAELGRVKPDLVVFDYFLHHLPFVFDGRFMTLGVGEYSHDSWGTAEEWLAGLARTQRVAVVSSWTPPNAEKDLEFTEIGKFDREYDGVVSKSFLDAVVGKRRVVNTLMLARLRDGAAGAAEGGQSTFSLPFDGGPLGMRGEWVAAPRGGMWSSSSSGFVGPLPSTGHPVEAVVETSWLPPKGAPATREVTIACNAGGATFTIGEGRATNTLVFASDVPSNGGAFGEYHVSVDPLFDPSQYGIAGFPDDLGVVFHSVEMHPAPLGD